MIKQKKGAVSLEKIPQWIRSLEKEDLEFIKNFVLMSGSLKEIAKHYDVSYPTVRLRLDRLIEKIKLYDEVENEEFIQLIKRLAIEDRIRMEDAKLIIETYQQERKKEHGF